MFLSPFGLYCSACFGILFVSILCTCCSHFFWYCLCRLLLCVGTVNSVVPCYMVNTLLLACTSLIIDVCFNLWLTKEMGWTIRAQTYAYNGNSYRKHENSAVYRLALQLCGREVPRSDLGLDTACSERYYVKLSDNRFYPFFLQFALHLCSYHSSIVKYK
jgi:hypothetical protein